MKNTRHRADSIQKLLKRLEKKQDDRVGITTLKGRAVSRSDKNVHLAIAGGIVAIPIANIETVFPLTDSEPTAVRIDVRNPEEIQPLLRVRPGGGVSLPGNEGTLETARNGEKVYTDRKHTVFLGAGTCEYTDTDTTSGLKSDADQCDDSESGPCSADDTHG